MELVLRGVWMTKNKLEQIMKKTFFLMLSFFLMLTTVMFSNENTTIRADEEPNIRLLGYNKKFAVRKININDGSLSAEPDYFDDFASAKSKMLLLSKESPHVVTVQIVDARDYANKDIPIQDKKEHTKIIAQPDHGFAQSYPYRIGSVSTAGIQAAKNTLDIYSNIGLTTNIGYLPAHYQMQVHDVIASGGSFVAEIEISGQRGYVDINKVDLIPLFYIESGKALTLGGNESFYTKPENAYSKVVEAEYYTVKNVGNYREISFNYKRTTPAKNVGTITYGLTPTWLSAGNYYSNDGIHFFKDIKKTVKVMDGSSQGEFYAYFQWLPVNTMSLHSGDVLANLLRSYNYNNSVYIDQSQAFVENQNKYGMNSLLVFAQASLESAYGTSDFARNRNNLFGWGAADSNPGGASYFDSVSDSVNLHMSQNLRDYMNPKNWKHFGFSFGNMSSGVSYKYASDPLYGMKVAGIAFTIDKQNGFKDYDNYQLMKISNSKSNAFTEKAGSGATLYSNKNLPNQIIASLGNSGNFTKTHSTVAKGGGRTPLSLVNDYAYIASSALTPIKKSGPTAQPLLSSLVTVNENTKTYTLNSAQSIRTEWNATSRILLSVPKGAQVTGKDTSNGYTQIKYGNSIGYILSSLLIEGPTKPVVPPKPSESKSGDYKVKSDPYNTLSLRSAPNSTSTILSSIPNGTELKIEDNGNAPWMLTTHQGHSGYVHIDYLVLVKVDIPVVPEVPKEPALTEYIVKQALNHRAEPNDNATVLATIPALTRISGYVLNAPWVKTTYNGKVGYVHGDYLTKASEYVPPKPIDPPKPTFAKGDVNGDGNITLGDLALIKSHLLGNRYLTGENLNRADINKDGNITLGDLAMLKAHLLGNITLK